MMVISIIAILVTLAVPAYLDYTIRTKVTECLNSASLPKMSISEYRMTSTPTSWPASAAASPGGASTVQPLSIIPLRLATSKLTWTKTRSDPQFLLFSHA